MKKSKRVLASVMSALLILPSFVLPFSGAAEEYPNADSSEPYYVVGRFQEKGTKVEGASTVTENTGADAETYPNNVTMGNVKVTASEPIDLTGWDTDTLALVMDITYTRADGKTGTGALNYTGNQMLHVNNNGANVAQFTGSPYLTGFTSNYGDAAGKTVTYMIPWNYVHTDGKAFVKDASATTVTDIMWQVYNDSWKVDIDNNGQFDDAYELDVAIENARIVDTSRLGDGSINPVVATWYDGGEIVANYQGSRTWDAAAGKWKSNNTMSHFGFTNNSNQPTSYTVKPDKVADLQVEFDVMVENADNIEQFDASKFNGILRLKIGDTQADYGYGWSNFVKTAGEWAHVTVPLADMFKGDKTLAADAALGSLQMFAYDGHDLREDKGDDTDPDSTQVRFVHAICHTKGVKLVDTSLVEEPAPTVDRTALEQAIADAEAKLTDGKIYTDDTLAALNEKLTAAKAVAEDADQETVNAAATALTDAIAALVEETDPVPDNYVLISKEQSTTNESHGMTAELTAAEALDLTQEAYQGRELFVTFKMKVDKTEQFPTSITGSDADWLKFLRNGATKIGTGEIGNQTCANGNYANVNEVGVWKDVTIAVPADVTSIDKLSVQFWNDIHNATGNDDDQNHGVVFSIKDAYLVVGDVKPVARWSAMNETLSLLNEGSSFYFDWKTADGIPDQNTVGGGIDMSGDADNGANDQYIFTATVKFDALTDLEGNPVDMVKPLMIRLRSSVIEGNNKEADWYALTAEDYTVSEAGDGYVVAFPLSKVKTANIDWTDVKQVLIRQELQDTYHQLVDGAKPTGRVESETLVMTLSDVKVVKAEEAAVDRTALDKAIADAEAKLADGKTYTEATLTALNEKLTAAKAVADDADQATVDAAAQALTDAINALQEESVTPPTPVDRTALNQAITDAEAKLVDGKTYTEATLTALNEKLTAAKAVADDADQATVNAAATALTDAIAALVEETQPVDPITTENWPLANGEAEMTTAEGHSLSKVGVAFESPIDLTQAPYVGNKLSVKFKVRINKTENFPAVLADVTEEEWIQYIRNGTLLLFGASTDDADKADIGQLNTAYQLSCGKAGNLLENASTTEFVEVEIPVPQKILDAGKISSYDVLIYNDLHVLAALKDPENAANYTQDNVGAQGVTMTVKDVQLVIDATDAVTKDTLKALLDTQKTGDALNGYTAASVAAYNALFTAAKAVYDNADATLAEIVEQVNILKAADNTLVEDISDGASLPMVTDEMTSPVQHYMSVNKTFETPIDFGKYGERESVNITLKVRVNKDDATFPESVTADPEEWMKCVVNGSLVLWAGETRVNLSDLDATYKLSCGVPGQLEYATPGLYSEVTFPVPAEILEAGQITKFEFFMYNDLHQLTGNESDQNNGLSISVTDMNLVLGKAVAVDKAALNAAIQAAEALTEEDLAKYTDASVDTFKTALANAKEKAADGAATQAEVDAAAGALTTAQNALMEIVYGDLTGDGEVKAEDALKALQAATGKITLTDKETAAADVDTTEGVSANDALLILQYATQKIFVFPVEQG